MTGLPPRLPMLAGSLLVDEHWLGDRVDQTAREWGCPERRTNATLWWYSASAVLLAPAVRSLVLTGAAASLTPSDLRFTLRAGGYLERVVPGPELPATARVLGRHLDQVLGQIILPLARAGAVTERSLWAIAADSLAAAVLTATTVTEAGFARAPALATSIAAAADRIRPLPRFVDVDPGNCAPPRRYVRRASCCLLFRVPDGKCLSCPGQTPADRHARLVRHARLQP